MWRYFGELAGPRPAPNIIDTEGMLHKLPGLEPLDV